MMDGGDGRGRESALGLSCCEHDGQKDRRDSARFSAHLAERGPRFGRIGVGNLLPRCWSVFSGLSMRMGKVDVYFGLAPPSLTTEMTTDKYA